MTLDGWKEIAAHLARLGCPERDRTTLWRWAQLPDPLPVYAVRGGAEKGGRILAESAEVEAWWRRLSDPERARVPDQFAIPVHGVSASGSRG